MCIRDSIKERAGAVPGYRIAWEPPILRHFQARLETMGRQPGL